jgi:hypothetical protein
MKVVAVIALAIALMGCTITPEAIIGLVAGETAGAGPPLQLPAWIAVPARASA